MKKICFLSGCLDNPGGTERVGISIANELVKEYEVHIISMSKKEKPYFDISNKIKIHYLNLSSDSNKKNFLKILFMIFQYIKKNKIDILIEIDLILRIYTLPIQLLNKNLKIISWEHFYYGENLGVKLRDYCRKIAAKKSDIIITLTKQDMDNYIKFEKIKNKIIVIPNPLPKKLIMKSQLKNKKIICVGRLTKQKGFDILINGSLKFFLKYPEWELEIFGEGEDRKELLDLIKKQKLEKNIKINEPTRNIYDEYLKSTIFILPSRFEPFGMVLIEAMSCGLVPIAFNSLGPNEIITNNYDGLIINEGNIEELFLQLEKLIKDKEMLKFLSENAREKVKKYYIEEVIKKWRMIIDEL